MANANRQTRIKGPTVVTMRGGGSGGHDPLNVGQFTDTAFHIELPTAQTGDAFQVEKPDGTVIYAIDSKGNLKGMSGVMSLTQQQAQITLTAANLLAMYAAPVQILAAPGVGLAIVLSEVLFEITTTATQFANGGIVGFQYDSTANLAGTLVHAGSIPATVVNAAAGTTLTGLWAASGANGLTIPANKGIFISNQTAPFITGTGTAKVWITYSILTL